MKRICLLVSALATFTGCAKEGQLILDSAANKCDNNGYTFTAIHYGDSRIVVLPLSNIGAGYEWRFHLLPQPGGMGADAYKDSLVTVTGGAGGEWLNTSGKYNLGSVITICVPLSAAGSEFKYDVTVVDVGMLDPRAKVE
jgi:hypothetical protein